MADLASTFGVAPEITDYGVYVGLVLNLSRAWARQAVAVWQGCMAAGSLSEIPFDWFDSILTTESEADQEYEEVNWQRLLQKQKRNIGWP